MKLIIDQAQKSFGDNLVIDRASHIFEQGKIYGLLGRNGAGKTTLFDLISNKKGLDGGRIYLQEEDGSERALDQEDLFYMVANPLLPNFLTGREFLQFFMDVNSKYIKDNSRSIDQLFDWISLEKKERDRLIQGYSLGTRNKLQMLMFILMAPPIILMDEPLTSLDVLVQMTIKDMLKSMEKKHIILFSTHILQLAKDLCDEVVILHKGQISGISFRELENEDFERQLIERLQGE